MNTTVRSFLIVSFALFSSSIVAEPTLEFTDAWSPEAPPGHMMAGFVTIHNPADKAIALVGGSSPNFSRVEIHDMSMDDGVMRMRRLEQLEIEPGESVQLESGGTHLMLIEPGDRLAAGDHINVTLTDSEGGEHSFELEVRPRSH